MKRYKHDKKEHKRQQEEKNKNDYDCTSGYNYSCYNPMITSVSTLSPYLKTLPCAAFIFLPPLLTSLHQVRKSYQ